MVAILPFDEAAARELVASHTRWHHTFEVYPGVLTKGRYNPGFLWKMLQIDDRCRDKTALDIGAASGYFSKQLATHGAEVLAINYADDRGFEIMRQLSPALPIKFRRTNIYEMSAEALGTFDIVLCLGVLYHLPDMLRGLSLCRSVCKGSFFLETWYDPELTPGIAAARYYRADTANNDITNFWQPNRLCILQMLEDAGFEVVRDQAWGNRIFVEARAAAMSRKMAIAYRAGEPIPPPS